MPKLPIGDIGPVEIVWDYGGTPINLSPFLGDVKLTREDSISKIFEEGYGDAPVDAVFAGSVMELEVPMTRSTLDQLEPMLPGSTRAAAVLTLKNKCGGAMYADAKAIVLKPMIDGSASATKSEWIHLYKCHPYNSWELGFARDGQRVFLIKFMVFPSLESGDEGEYGTIGVTP